jgi:hypothetical protein
MTFNLSIKWKEIAIQEAAWNSTPVIKTKLKVLTSRKKLETS